ncbi:MAG: hypothetical protein NC548_38345 [Lachnospiraceae bacterium]|nr:hypothetical protein [Lachnospiraceae bacterium]
MKPLEEIFFKACVHEVHRVGFKPGESEMSVRNIVNIFSRLGFPHKQLWGYLEKWIGKGFYEYGVTMDLGWFKKDKFIHPYDELYREMTEYKGVTEWKDGEFLEYVTESMEVRKKSKDLRHPVFEGAVIDDPNNSPITAGIDPKVLEDYRREALRVTGVPPWLLGLSDSE